MKIGQYISIHYKSKRANLMEIKTYFYFNANNNKHLKMCEFQLKLCLKEICKHTNKGIKIEKE